MTENSYPTLSDSSNRYEAAKALNEARLRKRISMITWFCVALILGVTFAFPMYFMVSSSFKAESEVLLSPIHWIPQDFQGLSRYQQAFVVAPLGRFFFNSILMASLDVVVTVFFSALAGYGFAKFTFRYKKIFFLAVLSTLVIPFQILLIPLYVQVRALGWADNYAGLIIPGIMNAFGVFMMRQFAFNIPNELLDAARIDGASEFSIFRRIVFPLMAPASASLAIIIFLFSWNNFLWPLVIVQSPEFRTLPVGMTIYTQPYNAAPQWATAMAVSTLATLPVAILFIFFQRYFVQGMLVSGIKG
jgi:multiple sugar transport system permease protein